MNRFRWYRELRGGVWIMWEDKKWIRDSYLSREKIIPYWLVKGGCICEWTILDVEDYT